MTIESLENHNITIEDSQSTFFVLKTDNQTLRFDFLDKKEFYIKKNTSAVLNYFEEHPLLFNHCENFVTVFINSSPNNAAEFIADVENAINEIVLGWRDWKSYTNDGYKFKHETFVKNVNDGNGKLLEAPFSIIQNVLKVCDKHNVSVNAMDNQLYRKKNKLVIIGDNYFIAKDFILR